MKWADRLEDILGYPPIEAVRAMRVVKVGPHVETWSERKTRLAIKGSALVDAPREASSPRRAAEQRHLPDHQ